jgi:hypothetical protein
MPRRVIHISRGAQREESPNPRFPLKARDFVALERGCRRRSTPSARCFRHDTQLSLIGSARFRGSSSIIWSCRRRRSPWRSDLID